MKKGFLLCMVLILCLNAARAQKTYWEVSSYMFENAAQHKGISLELGDGNQLIAYTNNAVTIGNGMDFREILKAFFLNYDVIRDSVNESLSNKLHFFYNPGGKNGLTLIQGKVWSPQYLVVDGKPATMKQGKDTINIYPRNREQQSASVFSFVVNHIEDLRAYLTVNTINDFIEVVNKDIGGQGSTYKPVARGVNFHTFDFQSRFTGTYIIKNGAVEGKLQPVVFRRRNISLSVAASLQNFKSYMTPSFNTSFDLYLKGTSRNEYIRLGAYWEPVFLFDKGMNGKLQTFRNDFAGLIYEYRRSAGNNRLGFYAPISIAYLVRRRGDFFEKNTFNFGIGGIKYGAMTLRPFMYFNDFFRNVSPSVQVSVSWSR
ncbi:hypothetical protein [Niabella hirudinis]|uniref:hypothetical protein n=1 Tax=Niabella hirudinis TaxID=1285929 RepID=UPI003EB8DCF1